MDWGRRARGGEGRSGPSLTRLQAPRLQVGSGGERGDGGSQGKGAKQGMAGLLGGRKQGPNVPTAISCHSHLLLPSPLGAKGGGGGSPIYPFTPISSSPPSSPPSLPHLLLRMHTLALLEFDRDRKSMSVLCKPQAGGPNILLVKVSDGP